MPIIDKPPADKSVTVKVKAPFRVVHPDSGEPFSDGQTVTVPSHVAEQWLRSRWVEKEK